MAPKPDKSKHDKVDVEKRKKLTTAAAIAAALDDDDDEDNDDDVDEDASARSNPASHDLFDTTRAPLSDSTMNVLQNVVIEELEFFDNEDIPMSVTATTGANRLSTGSDSEPEVLVDNTATPTISGRPRPSTSGKNKRHILHTI